MQRESAGGVGFAEAYGYELSGRLDTVHRGGALARRAPDRVPVSGREGWRNFGAALESETQ